MSVNIPSAKSLLMCADIMANLKSLYFSLENFRSFVNHSICRECKKKELCDNECIWWRIKKRITQLEIWLEKAIDEYKRGEQR